MERSGGMKRALCVGLFLGLLGALGWVAGPEIRHIGAAGLTQARCFFETGAEPNSALYEAPSVEGKEPVEIIGHGRRIRKTYLLRLGLAFLAGIALGCLFYAFVAAVAAKGKKREAEAPRATLDWPGPIKARRAVVHGQQAQKEPERTPSRSQPAQTRRPVVPLPPVGDGSERRIRQLTCFYGLSRLIEPVDVSLDQVFEGAVELIGSVYYQPENIGVRATFKGIQYKTDNFQKSEISQYAQINVRGEKAGEIEVYYLADKDENTPSAFVEEDRDLLNAVAERLGSVAERKQAAERLELFRSLIDRSNDCIFVVDAKWGRLLDVNERACESLGYTRKELLSMTVRDIDLDVPDDAAWQKRVAELRQKGDIVVEGRHQRSNSAVFPTETSLKLVTYEKEDYVIAITRDITERKLAQQKQSELIRELSETNQKVERINQELKDFAYVVSHDLKAPLRGIKTLADWISSDYADKLDETGKDQIGLLVARVDRMHNLIEGVLQYSRVGRVREKMVHVNLNELIPEIIDMVAPPENIKITVEDELPALECERTSIIQVFENLLSNAVKYMDKPKGLISICCSDEGDFWKFSVCDNGPGIEDKHFERIFRIFQTLVPRDEFESTGVGLTVVKKMIELYGGKIWVESKVGQGSAFFFTYPKSIKENSNAELEANIAC